MSPSADKSSSEENKINDKNYNRHHVIPRIRIPRKYKSGKFKLIGRWLEINVFMPAHLAFHVIFGDRYPNEQVVFLKKLCDKNGVLNVEIYKAYKKYFDLVFNSSASYSLMLETLKKWDLSDAIKEKYTDKLAALSKVLTKDANGGIPLERFNLQ